MEWIVILIVIGIVWYKYKIGDKKRFFYIGYDRDKYEDAELGFKLREPE